MGLFGCRRINDGLRSGDLDAKTTEEVGHMDSAMHSSRLSHDVVVHRGVRDGDRVFGEGFGRDLTGATWTERAYVSTSPRESFADSWAREGAGRAVAPGRRPVVMRILAPHGTSGVAVSDAEMLLDRGLTLRVAVDHGTVDGVRHLDIEIVQ